jgi:AcrR family transcriptional regulator
MSLHSPSDTRKTESPAQSRGRAGERRNLPADERRRKLLDAAVELFAEKGSAITAQALADRVHVTQPLIHRYFPTKTDLVAAICDRIRDAHWDPSWRAGLVDRARPLDERILNFYKSYLPHIYHETWYRSFWYAALADAEFAEPYLARVTEDLLVAIVGETRCANGFPGLDQTPPFAREIELVWGMHSTSIFLGVRRYVYRAPVSVDVETTVRDQMRAYLYMAPIVMGELMGAGAQAP